MGIDKARDRVVVIAPCMDIPWFIMVVYMAIRAYGGYRKRKHYARYMDGKKVV